jgi:hypothetical protein
MVNNLLQKIVDHLSGLDKKRSDAETYQKVVESRQLQAMGQVHNDPSNDKYVYRGLSTPPSLVEKTNPKNDSNTLAHMIATMTPTPSPTAVPQDLPPASNNYLESQVLPRTRKYGIPDALAAGQWAAEGRFVEPQNNNWFNLMYGGKVHPYQNLDTQTADYALTINNLLKNQGKDLKDIKDPVEVLRLLQSGKSRFEGHQADPQSYVNLVSNTPEFQRYYKSKQ